MVTLLMTPEDSRERRLAYLEKERLKLVAKSFLAMIEEAVLTVEITRLKILLMMFGEE